MKKYILLLTPLTLLTTARAQQELAPSIAALGYAFDDLAAQLGKAPRAGVRDLDVDTVIIQLAPIRTASMIANYLTDLSKKQPSEKKQYARALIIALNNFAKSGKLQNQDAPKVQEALEAALNVDALKIATALEILKKIGASEQNTYDLFASVYENNVNRILNDPNLKNRQLPKGLRDDIAQSKEIYDVLREIPEQSNSIAAQNFVQTIETLKQKLDSL